MSPTEKIPSALAEKFAAITALTDAFCEKHLNDEYRAEQVQADQGGSQDGTDVARMDIAAGLPTTLWCGCCRSMA